MITSKRLIEILRENAAECLAIAERKNSNYAGGGPEGNAFKNFDLVEILSNGKVTREMGMFVRMTDKLARLGTLMFGGQDAVGESVEDTLQDLSNYANLTLVAVRDKNGCYEHDPNIAREPIDDNSPLRRHARPILPIVSDYAKALDNQIDPSTPSNEDPKSILSRLFNLGGTDRRAA